MSRREVLLKRSKSALPVIINLDVFQKENPVSNGERSRNLRF